MAGLKTAWTSSVLSGGESFASSPSVFGGRVYAGATDGKLYVYSAPGTRNCSGSPTVCRPLWTAPVGAQVEDSSPAISGGVVYVGAEDGNLYAFSADGTTNCSGTPKVCQPLWMGPTGGPIVYASPVVVGGVVLIPSEDGTLYAFSADGTTNCSGSPKVCQPLWTAPTGAEIQSSPAVAGNVVFVVSDKLYAFSADGTASCSGSPEVCEPLWTAAVSSEEVVGSYSSPAVANGIVYVGGGDFYAFSAKGTTNCSGTPKVCQPLWQDSSNKGAAGTAAVAGGLVYVGWQGGGKLLAYSARGTERCSGTPRLCHPLWGAFFQAGKVWAPSVANGVVFAAVQSSGGGTFEAFDAAGQINCAGSPKAVCSPLWTAPGGGWGISTPAIANGFVYAGAGDRSRLFAFSL